MATTKKATTGKKAGAGARKGATKAKGVAKTTKTKVTAKAAPAAPAPPKAVPAKLNDRQREFLQKVKDAGEAGYVVARSIEQRTIDALAARKMLKKGARNKETGKTPYFLTKAAANHLPAAAAPPPPIPRPPRIRSRFRPRPRWPLRRSLGSRPRPRRPCEKRGFRDHPVHALFPTTEKGVLRLDPDARYGETDDLQPGPLWRPPALLDASIIPPSRATRILS